MNGIKVTAKSVYGVTRYYPANDAAEALAQIAGTKTIADDALMLAQTRLGLPVEVETETTSNVIDFRKALARAYQSG